MHLLQSLKLSVKFKIVQWFKTYMPVTHNIQQTQMFYYTKQKHHYKGIDIFLLSDRKILLMPQKAFE